MYKGPKHYYPSDTFNYNFENLEEDMSKKERLNKELPLRKRTITRSLQNLFQKKQITMKSKPLLYPCYFKQCKFQGHYISHHFQSNTHQLSSIIAKLHQSYLIQQVNFLTKVSKGKQNMSVLCSKCHLFFDIIDLHLHNNHQIRRKTKQLEKQIIKSKTLKQHFLEEINRKQEHDSVGSETSNKKSEKSEIAVVN